MTVRSRGFHSAHAAAQILFEETLYQDGSDGTPLVQVLQRQGIVPGARCRRLSQLCLASSPRMTRQPDAPRQASRWTRAWSTCRAPTGRAPLRCGAGGTVLERRAGRPPACSAACAGTRRAWTTWASAAPSTTSAARALPSGARC